jgi:hypothetical protein
MVIIPKSATVTKNLTDAPVAVVKLTGAGMHDDPIITVASKIEKINSLAEVEKIIKDLSEATGCEFFILGGAVVRGQELFAKSKFQGFKNFREYIEATHGIRYPKAMRAAQVYRKLVDLDAPWPAFENIGWTKVLVLVDVVTKENIQGWVTKAKKTNIHSLKVQVDAEKQKGKTATEQAPAEVKTITTKTFKLHEDQKQLVQDGLKKASEETGSAVDAVNLEAVFQSYMGGGLAFADVAQAMAYAAKHTSDAALFVQKQIAMMEKLFPQLSIAVEITFKETPPAA